MQEIVRHAIDKRIIREWNIIRKERLAKLEEKYEWDVKNIELYAKMALEAAIYSAVLDEENACVAYLRRSAQAYMAYLKLLAFDRAVTLDISDTISYSFSPIFNKNGIKVSLWLRLYYLGIILRDKTIGKFLASIPQSKFVYPPTEEISVLLKNYIAFSYSFLEEPDLTKLEACYKITDENKTISSYKISPENIPYLSLFMMNHELLALKSIFENDVDLFNDALEQSLKDHRAFWSQKRILHACGDPVCLDSNGFISLPLTAICVIAYDKKISIDYDSDYIPDFLITGENL
ncbi:MAG: immunity 49 family protein [Spirochaetales bacterium]|nr:immunity 49 family protein [Spirochaetales bacterium]